MMIRAAVALAGETGFSLASLRMEPPRADEVRVRIAGVGLCHTDLEVRRGGAGWFPFPAVLGHEGAGIVEAVGADVDHVVPGDAVILGFDHCGACRQCQRAQPAHCADMLARNFTGRRQDGSTALGMADGTAVASHFFGQSSFASHALVAARSAVAIAPRPDLFRLGPLGCGVQTGAGAVLNSLGAQAGDSILVLGSGSVGLSAVMAAVIAGCDRIVVVEPHASRRRLALELGATAAIDPNAGEPLPGGFDHVLDTSGRPDLIAAGFACLGRRGTLGLLATSPPVATLSASLNGLVSTGQRIIGIIEGDSDPRTFLPELLAHHDAGRLPFDRLIRTYPLADINEAIADQQAGHVVKAVLLP
jgi:aryl-alcohol dehydrogenase